MMNMDYEGLSQANGLSFPEDDVEELDSRPESDVYGSSDDEDDVDDYKEDAEPEDVSEMHQKADKLSPQMRRAYDVVTYLMSSANYANNWPFICAVDSKNGALWDYDNIVKDPVWLKKVREDILSGYLETPTEVFRRLRLMFRNCYRYNGPQHAVTRRALRLEHIMELQIETMDSDLQELCSLEATEGPEAVVDPKIISRRRTVRAKTPSFFSHVLHWVRHDRADREKEFRRQQLETKRQQRQEKEQRVVDWERRLTGGTIGARLQSMWEIPQLVQFVHLGLRALHVFEVPMYEMERMLLVPQSSETLAMLMSSLVSSPLTRTKLTTELPAMPYSVWTRKLATRVQAWYRVYGRERCRPDKLHDSLGIDPAFWNVLGPANPFDERLFHQLSFYQRVWMVKALCDYLFHSHKTVQECVMEAALLEPREELLGADRHGYEYIHLPQLYVRDVRVYRRRTAQHRDAPAAGVTAPALKAARRRSTAATGKPAWSRARMAELRKTIAQAQSRRECGAVAPRSIGRFVCLGAAFSVGVGAEGSDEDEEAAVWDEDDADDGRQEFGKSSKNKKHGRKSVTSVKKRSHKKGGGRAIREGAQVWCQASSGDESNGAGSVAMASPRKKTKGGKSSKKSSVEPQPTVCRKSGRKSMSRAAVQSWCDISSGAEDGINGDEANGVEEEEGVEPPPAKKAKLTQNSTDTPIVAKRSHKKGAGKTQRSVATPPPTDGTSCPYCLMSLRSERARKAHRCFQDKFGGVRTVATSDADSISETGAADDVEFGAADSARSRGRPGVRGAVSTPVNPGTPSWTPVDGGGGATNASPLQPRRRGRPPKKPRLLPETVSMAPAARCTPSWEEPPVLRPVTPSGGAPGDVQVRGVPDGAAAVVEDVTSARQDPVSAPITAESGQETPEAAGVAEHCGDSDRATVEVGAVEDNIEDELREMEGSGDLGEVNGGGGRSDVERMDIKDGDTEDPLPEETHQDAETLPGESPQNVRIINEKSPQGTEIISERPISPRSQTSSLTSSKDQDSVVDVEEPATEADAPAVSSCGSIKRVGEDPKPSDSSSRSLASSVAIESSSEQSATFQCESGTADNSSTAEIMSAAFEEEAAKHVDLQSVCWSNSSTAVCDGGVRTDDSGVKTSDPVNVVVDGGTNSCGSAILENEAIPRTCTDIPVLKTVNSDVLISAATKSNDPEENDTALEFESRKEPSVCSVKDDKSKLPSDELKLKLEAEDTNTQRISHCVDKPDVQITMELKSEDDQERKCEQTGSGSVVKRELAVKRETVADSDGTDSCVGGEDSQRQLVIPPEPADPDHIRPPDSDDFLLVADTFEGLRQLIDSFKPTPDSHACEIQLHKALSALLLELEPLEAKITQSVRNMRKRLCHEWLSYMDRTADYMDPNEEAWRDPDQEPEPNIKKRPKSPSPEPPETTDNLLEGELDGRRKTRSRRAKRKPVNYCVDGGSEAARQSTAGDQPQLSSRGRVRKVRKLDDFAYDVTERMMRDGVDDEDGEFRPPMSVTPDGHGGSDLGVRSQQTASGSKLPETWAQSRKNAVGRAGGGQRRTSSAVEPSPAWNSDLTALNVDIDLRVEHIRDQLRAKLPQSTARPRKVVPLSTTLPKPQTVGVTAVSRSRVVPLGARRIVMKKGGQAVTSSGSPLMSGASSPGPAGGALPADKYVLQVGDDGNMYMEKVELGRKPPAGERLLSEAARTGLSQALTGIDQAGPATSSVGGSIKLVAGKMIMSSSGNTVTVRQSGGVPSSVAHSRLAVVMPCKDKTTGSAMYVQLPDQQASALINSLNVAGSTTAAAPSVPTVVVHSAGGASAPVSGAPAVRPSLVRFPLAGGTTGSPRAAGAASPLRLAPQHAALAARVRAVSQQLNMHGQTLSREQAQRLAVRIVSDETTGAARVLTPRVPASAVSRPQQRPHTPLVLPRSPRPIPGLVRTFGSTVVAPPSSTGSPRRPTSPAVRYLGTVPAPQASSPRQPGPPPMQRAPRLVSNSVQFVNAAASAPTASTAGVTSGSVISGGAVPRGHPPAAAVQSAPVAASSVAPPVSTAAPPSAVGAQQGKIVVIKSGLEEKLGVLLANGQIVELDEQQSSMIKQQAGRRVKPGSANVTLHPAPATTESPQRRLLSPAKLASSAAHAKIAPSASVDDSVPQIVFSTVPTPPVPPA